MNSENNTINPSNLTFIIHHTEYTLPEIIDCAKKRDYDTSLDWLAAFYNFILEWTDPATDTIKASTSGSTGAPTLLLLSKKAMIASAKRTNRHFNIDPSGNMLLCMHCKYIGAKMMVVRALQNGNSLIITSPQDFPDESLFNYHFEFAAMVPLQFQYLIEKYPQRLSHFRKIILGGIGLPPKLVKKINQILPQEVSVFETYGMTETVSHIAVKKYDESLFTCLEGVVISTNEIGCLVIEDNFTGIKKTATRDIAEIKSEDQSPQQFSLSGRADNIINSGGIKISPEKIEGILHEFFTSNIMLAGLPDEVLGNKLILLIKGNKHPVDSNIFNCLSRYERPKEIYFIPQFKYTETEKINRKATLDLFLNGHGIDAE